MKIIQPENWKRPSGFSHALKTSGDLLFIAGQIGWDENCELVSDSLPDQVRQALENIVTILEESGAKPEHIARLNWYMADRDEYTKLRKEIGEVYRDVLGNHYPPMSLFEVNALLEEGARVEIEATAVIPD